MKVLTTLVTSAFLSLTVASSFAPAYAAPPDRMGGQDWATRGYNKGKGNGSCSSASAACIQMNGGSPEVAAKCQSARASCMSTGTFVGLKGKAFPGLAKN